MAAAPHAPPSFITLALETSQRAASVALRDRAGVLHEEALSPRKRHDDDMLPAIDRLFRRAGLRSSDLRGGTVCVSIGPGGFTGLRIAIAAAKMFAEALAVKLVAVPSALVAAEATIAPSTAGSARGLARIQTALVALACKGETFWATPVERGESTGECEVIGEGRLVQAESLDIARIDAVIADEFLPATAWQRMREARVAIIESIFSAAACLRAGERMLARGETIDPLRMLPLYPRQPEAVTLWEKRSQT